MTVTRYPTRLDRARIQSNSAQSFASGTSAQVALATTQIDTNAMKSGDSLVARRAGLYDAWGQVFFDATPNGGVRLAWLRINGAEVARLQTPGLTGSGDGVCLGVYTPLQLVPGDVLTMMGYQNCGGALLTVSGSCFLSMEYQGL